jgi:hypothetical protein
MKNQVLSQTMLTGWTTTAVIGGCVMNGTIRVGGIKAVAVAVAVVGRVGVGVRVCVWVGVSVRVGVLLGGAVGVTMTKAASTVTISGGTTCSNVDSGTMIWLSGTATSGDGVPVSVGSTANVGRIPCPGAAQADSSRINTRERRSIQNQA